MRPLLFVLVLLLPVCLAAQAPPESMLHAAPMDGILQTPAEQGGWGRLTSHEAVIRFYERLAGASPEARLFRIGESRDGRDLLLVSLARPAIADARAARASGKPIVLIVAQVHGDEPAGKEALMLFARDVADGPLDHLLDDIVFVLVPQLNPDGAVSGAWGRRTTEEGQDLNRDYLRLQHPEIDAVVERAIVEWRPHVVVDAHEVTTTPPLHDFYTLGPDNINGPTASARFTRERAIPAVVRAVEDAGFTHVVYRLPGDDPALGFAGGSHGPRALTSYAGAHGAISILFETLRPEDARIGIERRAGIHRIAMETLARYVADHRQEVMSVVDEGRREMTERGSRMNAQDSIAIRYDSTAVSLARLRPLGYAIESHREDLARHLMRHGIRVERTLEPHVLDVERFLVDSIRAGGAMYEGYVPQHVWTTARAETLKLPAGTFLVRSDQPASALLFHLLEPEGDNSYASAGAFDGEAAPGRMLSAYRLLTLPPASRALDSFP